MSKGKSRSKILSLSNGKNNESNRWLPLAEIHCLWEHISPYSTTILMHNSQMICQVEDGPEETPAQREEFVLRISDPRTIAYEIGIIRSLLGPAPGQTEAEWREQAFDIWARHYPDWSEQDFQTIIDQYDSRISAA
ncbi:MAG TPA: hypothetical protein VI873_03395 [Candidatus Peribacteraceae bacterium]|nr:hypothetical protein [Candidatus Peribacteraceae bacterium]